MSWQMRGRSFAIDLGSSAAAARELLSDLSGLAPGH